MTPRGCSPSVTEIAHECEGNNWRRFGKKTSAERKARVLRQLAFWGQLDYNSDMAEARAEGFAKGFAEGLAEGFAEGFAEEVETIISFLKKGGSIDDAKRMFVRTRQ